MQAVERIAAIGDAAAGIGPDAVILDIAAGQRRAAQQHRNLQPLARHFLQVLAHHHGGFHQQARHADGVRMMLLRRRQHIGQRHLDAEIDHPVAVVGQDDIDQVLADVVHVALHGGEHDGAFLLALDALHERLEIGHRRLHRLGALQHERQLHLAGAEQVADHLHAVEQHVVDDVERRQRLQRLVQIVGQALAVAIDDAVLQPAFHRVGALLHRRIRRLAVGEDLQQPLQRIIALRAAIEDQVLGDLHLLRRDQVQRPDLRHVHDRAGHSRRAPHGRGTRCSAPRAPPGSARS